MSSLEWCGLLVSTINRAFSRVLSNTLLRKANAHKKASYSVFCRCVSLLIKYVLWMDMMAYGSPWQQAIDYTNPQTVLVKRLLRSVW